MFVALRRNGQKIEAEGTATIFDGEEGGFLFADLEEGFSCDGQRQAATS